MPFQNFGNQLFNRYVEWCDMKDMQPMTSFTGNVIFHFIETVIYNYESSYPIEIAIFRFCLQFVVYEYPNVQYSKSKYIKTVLCFLKRWRKCITISKMWTEIYCSMVLKCPLAVQALSLLTRIMLHHLQITEKFFHRTL